VKGKGMVKYSEENYPWFIYFLPLSQIDQYPESSIYYNMILLVPCDVGYYCRNFKFGLNSSFQKFEYEKIFIENEDV